MNLNSRIVVSRKLILFVFLMSIIRFHGISQCDFSLLPDGELCTDAIYLCGNELDGYTDRMPTELAEPLPWIGLCNNEGSAENMTWIAFTVCDTTVTLRITPSNCENDRGIQAGLYRRCGYSVDCSPVIKPSEIGAISTFDLTWDGFVPGRVAYLVIDGMAGDVCDYTIEVLEGVDTTPASDVDENQLQDGDIVGKNKIDCKDSGDTLSYSMVLPTCLMNYADNCFLEKINIIDSVCFVWNVTNLGAGSYAFVDDDSVGTDVKIVFWGEGSDQFRIHVDVNIHPYYGGGCAKGACGDVNDLLVSFSPDEEIVENIELCPGESITLCGTMVTGNTSITCEDPNNPCRTLRYEVVEKPLRTNDLGIIYQCSGDYYDFMGSRYYNSGIYTIHDPAICDLVHQFEIKNVTISAAVQSSIRQLDCKNEFLQLETSVITDFPNDVQYTWTFQNQEIGFTSSITIQDPGRYYLTAKIDNGLVSCESTDFVDITLNKEKPVCSFLSPTLNCRQKAGFISYNANSPLENEKWTTPVGNVVNASTFPVDSLYASSGLSCRFQAVRIDNGCTIDTLVAVQSDFKHPEVLIQGDGILNCFVNEIPLNAGSDLQVDSIRWVRDGDFLISGKTTFTYDATIPGNYFCWMQASRNGCTNQSSKKIDEDKIAPVLELGEDKMWYCNTFEIPANPKVDRGGQFRYQWTQQNGGEIQGSLLDPDAVFTKPGNYLLKVSNSINGCVKTDSIKIIENEDIPEAILAEVGDPVCSGEHNGFIRNIEVQGGFEPYSWKLNGVALTEDNIQNLESGVYILEVMDKYDCLYKDSITLINPELLTVEPIEDVTVSFNETMDLEVITNYDLADISVILWRDDKGNIVGEGPYFTFDKLTNQTYEVEVINLNGCSAKTRVKIIVDQEVKFILSNIIKPGSGGNNDKISIKKNNIPVDIQEFCIYDRWGAKVFNSAPFSMENAETRLIEWDGLFQGRELQAGVYIMKLTYKDYFNNVRTFTTDITLLR